MDRARRREDLKAVNVAAYFFFLGSNIYTVTSPHPVYENMKQTYFTPTVWGFLVWPIIHILLLGTVIYQFTSARGENIVVHEISWRFPIMTTLYGIFVIVWANHYYTAAFAISLLLVYVVHNISWALKEELLPESMGDEFFVFLPFTVVQVWTVFINMMTAFEAFGVDATKHRNGILTNFFVVSAFIVFRNGVAALAVYPAIGSRLAGCVIPWLLWTISDNQRSSVFIHWSAIAFFILALLDLVSTSGIYHKLQFVDDPRRRNQAHG